MRSVRPWQDMRCTVIFEHTHTNTHICKVRLKHTRLYIVHTLGLFYLIVCGGKGMELRSGVGQP